MRIDNSIAPTRQTLLSRLKDWTDQDSWKDFFDIYWRLIYKTAIRLGLTETEAQDAVQETIIAACRQLPEFRYDRQVGSFRSWLLQITRCRIADQIRHRMVADSLDTSQESSDGTALIDSIAHQTEQDLQDIWEREWRENQMNVALERVRQKADPFQYQIFDLQALQGLPVTEICQSLKIGAGRIYLAKHRISKMIKKEIKLLESQMQ